MYLQLNLNTLSSFFAYMKKQLSSIDLHYLVEELQALKGSRIDKIYNPEKNLVVFSFFKSNEGKRLLKIHVGQSMFLSEEKDDYEDILGFGQLLRKHLDGYSLTEIWQIEPERIAKLEFKSKSDKKHLYIEFFGKGNAILCDEKDVIINSLEHHEFRDRTIKPKIIYKYPVMGYNIFDLDKKKITDLLVNSKKETLVICLAVELGFGGIYSEEACMLAGIDKNKNPKGIEGAEISSALSSVKKIISKKIEPEVILQDGNPVDVVPFELEYYKNFQKKTFPNFSEALSFFYAHFKEIKETEFDKKMKSLQRIIEEQKTAILKLKEEEKESREKGELIYHKYSLIKEILDEVNKASKKYSWKEIKEKLKEHKIIKEINEKERKVVVEV